MVMFKLKTLKQQNSIDFELYDFYFSFFFISILSVL